jgi:hypothetical protein
MASQSWVHFALSPNFNFGNGTWYNSLTGLNDGEDQAHSQVRVPAGQFSDLYVSAHSITGTATATSNKNNANGNQSVSITAAGLFQDNTHNDLTANGDKFCTKIVGATFTELASCGYLFDTSFNSGSGNATNWIGQGSTSSGNNAGGYFGCGTATNATEARVQVTHYSAGTYSNIQVWETNGFQTFTARNGGVNSSLAVISANSSWADDNTHTMSVAANDLISYGVNATSTERTYGEAMRFVSSDGGYELAGVITGSGNINVTTFSGCVWGGNGIGTEADWQAPAPYQCKLTEMRVDVYASGGTGTMHMRKNGVNGNGSVSWGGTVGLYIDTVSSDTFNTADKHAYEFVPSGGASNLDMIAVHVAPGVSSESTSVSLAIGNPQFNISASDPSFTKSVNLAVAEMEFNVSENRVESTSVNLAIAELQFNAQAHRQETVSVSLAIANPQLAVQVVDLAALNKLRQFTVFG